MRRFLSWFLLLMSFSFGDEKKSDVVFKDLVYQDLPEYITSGKKYLIRFRLTKNNQGGETAFRLHEVVEPKKGGLFWANPPKEKLEALLAKAKDRSVIVSLECVFSSYSVLYQRKPGRDPFARVTVFRLVKTELGEPKELKDPSGTHK